MNKQILEYIESNPCDIQEYKGNLNLAIIIETRPLDSLNWVINNIAKNTGWQIRCYCSMDNVHLVPFFADKHIIPSINEEDYNNILTSLTFWESVPENVLIFQADSFMLKGGLQKFTKYDYVGSPWKWSYDNNLEQFQKGGNGGISFRKKRVMERIIRKFPPDEHRYQKLNPKGNEDMYFSMHLDDVGAKTPNLATQKTFGVETMFYPDPMCVHAIDKWLTEDEIKIILK